jgi:hypothetical protein
MFEYRPEPIQLDTERSAAYELSDNPHGDYCYSVHFVGREDMIAQLAQAYPKNVRTPSENRQESSPLPEGFTEVIGDMLEEAVLARMLRDFPYLKCTGFHESWSKLAYYVFFSASGYPFITEYKMADYFDKHSDGGAGRFGAEIDVLTRNYYASYLHCQTGTYCGVECCSNGELRSEKCARKDTDKEGAVNLFGDKGKTDCDNGREQSPCGSADRAGPTTGFARESGDGIVAVGTVNLAQGTTGNTGDHKKGNGDNRKD